MLKYDTKEQLASLREGISELEGRIRSLEIGIREMTRELYTDHWKPIRLYGVDTSYCDDYMITVFCGNCANVRDIYVDDGIPFDSISGTVTCNKCGIKGKMKVMD